MFLGISYLEWSANLMTAVCIFLAGRNNVHTWWTGIVACILFGALFYQANLYADVTLQAFFIVTGFIGWWNWVSVRAQSFDRKDVLFKVKEADPITKVSASTLQKYLGVAVLVAIGYGFLLHKFTNAYAPWIDSTVLTLSVVAQLLLMRRQLQNWPVWVVVNILSVPLYFSRELYLSAALYSVFLVNAIVSWRHWLNLFDEQERTLKA
jgi:nicotinamide mononucleotide transporter